LRYFLQISYQGTRYAGWQKQPNALTVQGILDQCLMQILGEEISSQGAGRTDTGVHASQLFIHFDTNVEPPAPFLRRINGILPPDIAVHALLKPVNPTLHARFDAKWRSYTYRLHFKKDPFIRHTSAYQPIQPDPEKLQVLAAEIKTAIDFKSFAKSQGSYQTTYCKIYQSEWEILPDEYRFHIRADRFLRGMVRLLVGTQLSVASGKLSFQDFTQLLHHPQDKKGGPSADPHGLTLTGVGYNPDSFILIESV